MKFSIENLFPEFQPFESGNVDTKELEKIIIDAVEREHPGSSIEDIEYTEDGMEITLDTGESIEIEIDWQEIILT